MKHDPFAGVVRDEDRLLISCASTRPDSEIKSRVNDLLNRGLDWSRVIEAALQHGVLPLLYRRLHSIGPDRVPGDKWSELQRHFLANSARNHFLTRELIKLLTLLDSHGIAAVPLKGPVLAGLAYADVALRQFEDLDILVLKSHALQARELLYSSDYADEFRARPDAAKALLAYQQHVSLLSPAHGATVELHWSLEHGQNWTRFSNTDVWERLTSLDLDGSAVRTLSLSDQILYLCVHGASHCWDRLIWICDVARLLRYSDELDWDFLIAQATNLNRKRMLLVGLSLAHNLLGGKVPQEIVRMVNASPNVAALMKSVRDNLFKSNLDRPGLGATFVFRFAVRESIVDKIRFGLRRLMIPDAIDLNFVSLPLGLCFLYFLIRPIRLAFKGILGMLSRLKKACTWRARFRSGLKT